MGITKKKAKNVAHWVMFAGALFAMVYSLVALKVPIAERIIPAGGVLVGLLTSLAVIIPRVDSSIDALPIPDDESKPSA